MKLLIDADGCPVVDDAIITPIIKGWSQQKKYCVETTQGERYLLRVTEKAQYSR